MEDVGIFYGPLVPICILRPVDKFYGPLIHFVVIWYIFFLIWYFVRRKIWQPCPQPPKLPLRDSCPNG
jgi:hypothetical protein